MKILAIMGSPRKKGKGYNIVKKFEDHLKLYDSTDFEYIYLTDINLEMCRGCFLCVTHGEDKCPIKDNQKNLESKMLESDGIIFCSPVYGHNVSGQMKVFIDRFSYNGHHPRFFTQKALFIANTCGMGLKGALEGMKFIEAWGFHVVGQVGIKWPHYKQSEKEQSKNDKIIEKYAKKFFQELKTELPRPQTNQIMQYNIMKTIMNKFENYDNMFPGDLEYWGKKGWLKPETSFFYETKLSVYHKLLGFVLRSFFKVLMPFMASN